MNKTLAGSGLLLILACFTPYDISIMLAQVAALLVAVDVADWVAKRKATEFAVAFAIAVPAIVVFIAVVTKNLPLWCFSITIPLVFAASATSKLLKDADKRLEEVLELQKQMK